MNRTLFGFLDLSYLIKFLVIFLGLYSLNLFIIGITTPGGLYSPFVEKFFNYPVWVRSGVLHGAHTICSSFGYQCKVDNDVLENFGENKLVRMGWPCYVLMIMSFWTAFIMAQPEILKRRLKWTAVGLLTIFAINITRISVLYISLVDQWTIGSKLNTNNHDLFDYVSYLAIAVLMFIYKRRKRKQPDTSLEPALPVIA